MKQFAKSIGRLAAVATITFVSALAGSASAHITVLAPNGGEQLDAGTVVTISWRILIAHNQQNWDLWYSTTGNNGPWIPIAMDLPPGNTAANSIHTFDWTIPEAFSDQCRVRVRMDNAGTDYEDTSDADFSIVAVPVDVNASSFLVTRGQYVSGGLPELEVSDNLDLSIRRLSTDTQSRTEFEVSGTSPTDSPTSFACTLEGAVFARSNVIQTIELFDYVAAAWELVDARDAARSPSPDSVVTFEATGDLSRFVEAGTMAVEARVRYKSESTPRQNFASNTDQFIWTIGQ